MSWGRIGSPTRQPIRKYRAGSTSAELTVQERVQRAIEAGLRARRKLEKEQAHLARRAAAVQA